MLYGWMNKILRIDLTKGDIREKATSPFTKILIGGRGINAKILFDEVPPEVDALDPRNRLIFGTGPLTGTLAPGSGKVNVKAKSPITGLQGDTNFGGFWGPELKFAGYDHLLFEGKSKKPVYLWINDDDVEIRDATSLWGKSTSETTDTIRREIGDPKVRVVSIGPAGEKMVRFACIITELKNTGGRTGMGAVMGSKNLKAVAVRGSKKVKIAKPDEFSEICEIAVKILTDPETNPWYPGMADIGIADWPDIYQDIDLAMVGNQDFTFSTWRKMRDPSEITSANQRFLRECRTVGRVKPVGCFSCPIRCQMKYDLPDIGEVVTNNCTQCIDLEGTIRNPSVKLMLEIFKLLQEFGMDVVATGNTLAFIITLYERGIISKEDTDGIELRWGDRNSIIAMVNKIGKREGFGDILAAGPARAAKEIGRGAEQYAFHIKDLPVYGLNFRGYYGMALAAATGTRGDFLRSWPALDWFAPFFPEEKDKQPYYKLAEVLTGTRKSAIPNEYEGKAESLVYYEDVVGVHDVLVTCKWHGAWFDLPISPPILADMFSACTGIFTDQKRLFEVAERVRNIERAYDVREGLTRETDTLPKKFFTEPLPDGPFKGKALDKAKFEKMKSKYYLLRGWNGKTGIPTREKLVQLGLDDIAEELTKRGKI